MESPIHILNKPFEYLTRELSLEKVIMGICVHILFV